MIRPTPSGSLRALLLLALLLALPKPVAAQSAGDVITMEEARAEPDGATVTVEGIVTRAGGRFVRFQDETAGLTVFQSSGAFRDAIEDGAIAKGDRLRVRAQRTSFAEQLQLDPEAFSVRSRGNDLPDPAVISLEELNTEGEQYESELVRVEGLTLVGKAAVWEDGTSYDVQDETDTGVLRTPEQSENPGIVDQAVPQEPFTFQGVAARYEEQFQLWPLEATDIFTGEAPPEAEDLLACEIQGSGLASPFVDQEVTTAGNVVTTRASNGFFIQMPAPDPDCPEASSRGLFVFTGGSPQVSPGDEVTVTGEVQEFHGWTQIGSGPQVSVTASGQALPDPVTFNATTPAPEASPVPELERYESMQVRVENGVVTGPTDNFGVFRVDASGEIDRERNFRREGARYPGMEDEPDLPVWNGNPHLFAVEPGELPDGPATVHLPRSSSVIAAEGPLTYRFDEYHLWPETLETDAADIVQEVRPPQEGEVHIATFNLHDFLHPDENSNATTGAYERNRGKLARHICELLEAPAVVGVQEVSGPLALEDLASHVEATCSVGYEAHTFDETNDARDIRNGVLVREEDVTVDRVEMLAAEERLSFSGGNVVHDRPPLLLEGEIETGGEPFPFAMLVVHNRSRIELEENEFAQRKRLEQAASIAEVVQGLQEDDPDIHLFVAGDFNDFEFTDAYADLVRQVTGTLEPGRQLWEAEVEVDPPLKNRVLDLEPRERYSYVFEGSAQVLDHILTSEALDPHVTGVQYARANADAPHRARNQARTPEGSSDHDAMVVYLDVGQESVPPGGEVPDAFELEPSFPNPAVGMVTIRYHLPEAVEVHLAVYDALGRQVAVLAEGHREADTYEFTWDPVRRGLSSGVYFIRLEAGDFTADQQMVVVR